MKIPLIEIHVGLFKFLRAELKKKRALVKLIYLLRDTFKQYFKVLLHEYKMLLYFVTDKKYREAKKKLDRRQKTAKELIDGLRCWLRVMEGMEEAGVHKRYLGLFLRDIVKHPDRRKQLFEELIKQLEAENKRF